MSTRRPVFHGGKVHVCAERCPTCIFRPGNPMRLAPGRVKSMVERSCAEDAAITCHSTLGGEEAVCRGFFDTHKTTPLQLAERLDVIEWQAV